MSSEIPGRKNSLVPKISFPLISIFIFLYWGAVGAAPKHWFDFWIHEVTLLDCGYINFLFVLGQSPCNWRTMMPGNVVLTTFHTQQMCDHAWKTVRITFWSIIVLQLQGDLSNILFPTFQDLFPAIEEQRYRYKCIYFFLVLHTVTYMLCLERN